MTPPELARRYHVKADKVLAWIRAGELRALNIATTTGGRPRWLILPESIADFEARRSSTPPPRPVRIPRRRKPVDVLEFF
jgi:hypothetical protein